MGNNNSECIRAVREENEWQCLIKISRLICQR